MTTFTETYRGFVQPWECDVVEHFTVGFYYEKFRLAGDRALLQLGMLPKGARSAFCYTRYLKELRAGAVYRIESAPILRPMEAGRGNLTIAHRLVDASDGAVAATTEQSFATQAPVVVESGFADWDGEVREERPGVSADADWVPTAIDVIQPRDVDADGRLTIDALVHRFTTAGGHLLAAIDWSPSYLYESRIGYSTFEFQMRIHALPWVGVPLDTESTVASIGRSSMRMVHRMVRADTGDEVAELSQFGVHLDLEARRPTPIPDSIADKARALAGVG